MKRLTDLEALVVRMHAARRLVLQLKRQRKALQCERERRLDNKGGTEPVPCWKKDKEGDCEGGALLAHGGEDPVMWCAKCQERQRVHERLCVEKPLAGELKRKFWRTAEKLRRAVQS